MLTRTRQIALLMTLGLIVGLTLGWARGTAYADDGDLDFSFGGGDGLVVTNFYDTSDEARAVAIQADGKIVAAGTTHITGTNYDFSVARYNPDGSPDNSFSGIGKLSTDFSGHDDKAYGVAIQPDGKIVVVGTSGPYGTNGDIYAFAAVRYQPNGDRDTTFEYDGRVLVCFRGNYCGDVNDAQTSVALSVAIQADGKIVMAGSVNHESSPNFGLARLTAAGELDGSFDGDGKLTTNFFGGVDEARGVVIQPDGKIVAAGTAQVSGANYDFAFARYNSNGSLDGDFDGDGKATADFFGGEDGAYSIALQPDGKIVAAGTDYYEPSSFNFGVARLLDNGDLDTGFGNGGVRAEDLGGQGGGQLPDVAHGVAIQADGKIVAAGYAPAGGVNSFALARFNPDGFLDTSFGGGDGWLTNGFGGGVAIGFGVAIQPSDGKIVTAGTAYMGEPHSYDYAVARYLSGGLSNPTPTPTSVATTPTACPPEFPDVPVGSTFYDYVMCLACRGIVSGYPDGTFGPNNPVTRGQLSKIVSNSAGYIEDHTEQSFEDVAVGSTFHLFIERLFSRGYIAGYACGGVGEPCVPPGNRPYFRPNNQVTRGQTAKIVASAAGLPAPPPGLWTFQDVPNTHTFWQWIEELASSGAISGYPCGGAGEPCVPPENRYYFRPANSVTRGQSAKIVTYTFFPQCVLFKSR